MSRGYDEYLNEHRANVIKGFDWMVGNIPELFRDNPAINFDRQIYEHDESKTRADEYHAYDAYFYGNNRSYKVVQDFNKAWLLHIHRNPHHWQHWILIHDDPEEDITVLDMPVNYIIEMICDWWAFSWKNENLYEIFDWYEQRKNYIRLSDNTRLMVENIPSRMRTKLDEVSE